MMKKVSVEFFIEADKCFHCPAAHREKLYYFPKNVRQIIETRAKLLTRLQIRLKQKISQSLRSR